MFLLQANCNQLDATYLEQGRICYTGKPDLLGLHVVGDPWVEFDLL